MRTNSPGHMVRIPPSPVAAAALLALLLAALAGNSLLPELIAAATRTRQSAWEYASGGALQALLCTVVGVLMVMVWPQAVVRLPTSAVCGYGATEAALLPVCRLALPMDLPTPSHPQGLCGAAGWPWWWQASPFAVSLCAVAISSLWTARNTPSP